MDTAAIILKHDLDQTVIEELESLRLVRLSLAEKLLKNIDKTKDELKRRGLVANLEKEIDHEDLKKELRHRVDVLKFRVAQKNVVFVDEIELYADLLGKPEEEISKG